MGKYQGNTSSCPCAGSHQNRHNHIRCAKRIQHWRTNGKWSFVVPYDECKFILQMMMGLGNVGENGYRMNPDAMRFWLHRNVSVMV